MPQASDELRAEIIARFGSIDTDGPEEYLRSKGWTLHPDWTWSKPGFDVSNMPRDEFECAMFLVHEWDYGNIRDQRDRGAAFRFARTMSYNILMNPWEREWTVQGLGMLRTYLDAEKTLRLHLWSNDLYCVGDTNIHTHPWDFKSGIVSGVVSNSLYDINPNDPAASHNRLRIQCGEGGCEAGEPTPVKLLLRSNQIYKTGQSYTQKAEDIHATSPHDGSVSVIRRTFRPELSPHHADIFYPVGTQWQSAATRPAEWSEVRRVVDRALDVWQKENIQ